MTDGEVVPTQSDMRTTVPAKSEEDARLICTALQASNYTSLVLTQHVAGLWRVRTTAPEGKLLDSIIEDALAI